MNILDAVAGWVMALRRRDGDIAGVEHQRRCWQSLADRLGLAFHPGPHRGYFQGDRIEGRIDGRTVRIQSDADYDIQKLVVTISIECDISIPDLWNSRHELVPRYDAHALDHRERQLIYRQLYEFDEQTIESLLAKLLAWAHQLEGVRS